jgi:hypothetical protein
MNSCFPLLYFNRVKKGKHGSFLSGGKTVNRFGAQGVKDNRLASKHFLSTSPF